MSKNDHQCRVYAHSVPDAPETCWQTMRCHANAVAGLAEGRAAKFGAATLGRICGLLHDVGKYSDEFQRKLRGATLRVDHSTAGACIAAQRYPQTGQLIAYVIAGHHAGLANGAGDGDVSRPGCCGMRPVLARQCRCNGVDGSELGWLAKGNACTQSF